MENAGSVKSNECDVIFVAPWIGSDYDPDIKMLRKIFPYANKFNTYLFSEYNASEPHKYDFPTGIGEGKFGLLLTDVKKQAARSKLLPNPYLMVHLTEDKRVSVPKCLGRFLKMMCKKYHKRVKNLDVVVPQHVIDDEEALDSLSKYIISKGYYDHVEVRRKGGKARQHKGTVLTFRGDITPLPYKKYNALFEHCLPDVLLTGDQSVTDVMSCCRKYNIYYQMMPWKRNFGKQLSDYGGNAMLRNVNRSCGGEHLDEIRLDIKNIVRKFDFRKLGKRKMDAVLMAVQKTKDDEMYSVYVEAVLSSRKRSTVIDKFLRLYDQD